MIPMKHWKWLAAVSALFLAIALARPSEAQIFGSDPESLKKTDSLIKKAEGTIKQAVTADRKDPGFLQRSLQARRRRHSRGLQGGRKRHREIREAAHRGPKATR
jgi:hypothetical protein